MNPARPEPAVGVVIPLYNHEKYIAGTLRSVLSQTRPPDRIVIVDDGSADDGAEIVRGFQDSEPRIELHTQENRGAHVALNRAIGLAAETCEFLAILNSDDSYLPRRLEECLAFAMDNPHAAMIVTDLQLIDDDDNPLDPDAPMATWKTAAWSRQEACFRGDITPADWLGLANFPMTTSNIFARSDYLRENPFRAYRYAHDIFALATAAIRDKLEVLPETLLEYRVHAQNTIKTAPAKLTTELQRVHLDLARALAREITDHPETRGRYAAYLRGAAENISSFRLDVFHALCAGLAAGYSDEEIEAGLAGLTAEKFPELEEHPNTGIIPLLAESKEPTARETELAQSLKEARKKSGSLRDALRPARDLAKLRQQILASRWMTLGRAFGAGKHWARDEGKSAEEKLTNLRRALHQSPWYKLLKPFPVEKDSDSAEDEA